jgi:hypothetical protein
MALRDELLLRIEKKKKEIKQMETKIREAGIYVEALEETLSMIPQDGDEVAAASLPTALREGTNIAKAREALQRAGRPLHLVDLLKAMGKPVDKESRAALAGSLGSYARRNEIFLRAGPNTFGLIEGHNGEAVLHKDAAQQRREPPPNFGVDETTEEDIAITDDDIPF